MILVISNKTVYAAKRLAKEFKILACKFKMLSVSDLAALNFEIKIDKFTALYVRSAYYKTSPKYIPHIVKLAKKFKQAGKKVVDSNIAKGNLGLGKWYDYQALKKARLPIPETKVYKNFQFSIFNFQPLVLKWIYGFGGSHTHLINNYQKFLKVGSEYSKKELLVQEYIPAEYEYKIITVGYKSLPVVLRFRPKAAGFKMDLNRYSILTRKSAIKAVKIAEKAARVLGRELAKVDILEAGGKFYILEVNRTPSLLPFEPYSRLNVAREFVKYLQS